MTNQSLPSPQPTLPSDPEAEKIIQWLAGNIDKGLSRAYAVKLNGNGDAAGHEQVVEYASQRKELLAPSLTDIACEGIDNILRQAKTLGREGNFLHVQCTRVANELMVLSDRDPRYDWILPAVQNRLREELHNLHYDPADIEIQSFDLTCGEPLRFLDFELQCVRKRSGELRTQYRFVKESSRRQTDNARSRSRRLGRYHPLRFVQSGWRWLGFQRSWQFVRDAYRKINAIQVSWTHLPVTMYPIVAFLYGWRSPAAWFCLALIFLCNGRWTLTPVRATAAWIWRHKLDSLMATCVLATVICLWLASKKKG